MCAESLEKNLERTFSKLCSPAHNEYYMHVLIMSTNHYTCTFYSLARTRISQIYIWLLIVTTLLTVISILMIQVLKYEVELIQGSPRILIAKVKELSRTIQGLKSRSSRSFSEYRKATMAKMIHFVVYHEFTCMTVLRL